jgi:ABC-type glycerol-3-phosphate transport system substrate-binding protein
MAKQGLSRRSFIAKGAAVGAAAALSTDLLRNLSVPGTASAASGVTFSLNDMPAASDKPGLAAYQAQVAAYEKANPGVKIVGEVDSFDPTIFYTRYAAGKAEDTYKVYFTDVQHLIQLGYAADISAAVKAWQYYGSIQPSVITLASDASGSIYGFPCNAYSLGLAYRKQTFAAAGLDPNKPPLTWDTFRAYAAKLTNPHRGIYGYGPLSLYNTGGWHLCAMMFSYGGQPEIVQNGKLVANLTSANCVKPLQLLYDMRWKDGSIGPKEMGYNDNTAAIAANLLGMGILAGDQPHFFQDSFNQPINDFMLVGLPQGGGNATLTGGNMQMVKPGSSADVINAAIGFTAYRYWDLTARAVNDKAILASDGVVGVPSEVSVAGAYLAAQQKADAPYRNVNLSNYSFYLAANLKLTLQPEVRVQAQGMYALLDTCVQTVLSSQSADPAKLLATANTKFQALLNATKM